MHINYSWFSYSSWSEAVPHFQNRTRFLIWFGVPLPLTYSKGVTISE